MHVNTVEILAEQGDQIVKALKTKAATLTGEPKKALEKKIEVLQKMIEVCKSVPDEWTEHEKLASRPRCSRPPARLAKSSAGAAGTAGGAGVLS